MPLPGQSDVDLLWRGYTRHGVSPVNVASSTARFKAAIAKGILSAITPEGSDTTSSVRLHRYQVKQQRWMRHIYSPSWRSIHREPDGTLIAGDNAGFVWIIDTGTQDGSTDIALTIWTGVDDNDQPNNRKDGYQHITRIDTGGNTATIGLYADGSSTTSVDLTASSSGLGLVQNSLSIATPFRGIQHRITGSFSTFRLYDLSLYYRDRPVAVLKYDTGPIDTGTQNLTWIRELRIKVSANAALTVTPYFDGTAMTAYDATSGAGNGKPTILNVPVGRQYKGKVPQVVITSASQFEVYWIELLYRGSGHPAGKKTLRVSA